MTFPSTGLGPGDSPSCGATLPAVGRVGAFLFVLICAATSVGVAGATTSPKSLRAAILQAVSAEDSAHYVVTDSGRGFSTSMVCDVAAGRGIQRITIVRSGRTGHVTVLVADSRAYFRGDSFGLHAYMGLSASQASRDAGRWLVVSHSSSAYASIAADVTFASFASHLVPKAHLALVSATLAGRKLVGVRGTTQEEGLTVTNAVYAPKSGTRLPAEATAVIPGPQGGTGRTTISKWNEQVRVQAPAHATPIY